MSTHTFRSKGLVAYDPPWHPSHKAKEPASHNLAPFDLEGWGKNAKGNPKRSWWLSNGKYLSITLFIRKRLVAYCVYYDGETTFPTGEFKSWAYAAIAAEEHAKRLGVREKLL